MSGRRILELGVFLFLLLTGAKLGKRMFQEIVR
jgi:hypothetical protein